MRPSDSGETPADKPFIFSFLGSVCLSKLLSLSPQTAQTDPFKLLGESPESARAHLLNLLTSSPETAQPRIARHESRLPQNAVS
jgi:hypothetical protein